MNDKEKTKNILREIKEKKFDEERILTDEEIRIIKMCKDEQYITSDSQSVIYLKGDNKFILDLSTRLREKGCDLLKGIDRNKTQPTQTFNVNTAYGSAFGNHSSVTNNYSNTPVEDLKDYVNSLTGEDKVMGEELVDTLEKGDVKPGSLSKFEGFISKYPKTIDLIASALTSFAVSGFTS